MKSCKARWPHMVSALVSGSSDPGSSPGLGHILCCILGKDTSLLQCLSQPGL